MIFEIVLDQIPLFEVPFSELIQNMSPAPSMCLFTGLSSLGVPGVPWHTQILADQLTLFQTGGADYALLITTRTPGFSVLTTALI